MIKFYLTETSLSNIVLSNSIDLQILMKQNTIYVNIENEILDEYRRQYKEDGELNEENIIISLENGDCQIEATTLADDIIKDEQLLSNYPEAVFVLDIRPEDAKRLQDQYGILVVSEDNIDFSALTEGDFYTCKKGEKGNWEEALEVASKKPFNTIIINDRNLFTDIYKDVDQKTMHYGVDNIKSIITSLVAKKNYTPVYPIEVLLGFEGKNVNITKINKELTDKLSDIVKKYKLVIELIGYDGRSSYWDFSHNRWMATNYATITTEHKFSAFREGVASVDQDIFYKPFYAEGLKSNNKSKHPITAHCNKIQRMADNIGDISKNAGKYKHSIDFQVDVKNEIRNRLLKEYLTKK